MLCARRRHASCARRARRRARLTRVTAPRLVSSHDRSSAVIVPLRAATAATQRSRSASFAIAPRSDCARCSTAAARSPRGPSAASTTTWQSSGNQVVLRWQSGGNQAVSTTTCATWQPRSPQTLRAAVPAVGGWGGVRVCAGTRVRAEVRSRVSVSVR
eukprot:3575727-Prymnesium_polylepis.1